MPLRSSGFALSSFLVLRLPPLGLGVLAAAPARRSSVNNSATLRYYPAVLGGILFPSTPPVLKNYSVSATLQPHNFLYWFFFLFHRLKKVKKLNKHFKDV